MNVRIPHGMQEIRGSTPRSSTFPQVIPEGAGRGQGGLWPLFRVRVRVSAQAKADPDRRVSWALVVPVARSLLSGVSGWVGQGPGRARPAQAGAAGVLEAPGRGPIMGRR